MKDTDFGPVEVSIELADIENLLEAAQVCAEDLGSELNDRYPTRATHPTQERRYENDMDAVHRLRACVAKVRIRVS